MGNQISNGEGLRQEVKPEPKCLSIALEHFPVGGGVVALWASLSVHTWILLPLVLSVMTAGCSCPGHRRT